MQSSIEIVLNKSQSKQKMINLKRKLYITESVPCCENGQSILSVMFSSRIIMAKTRRHTEISVWVNSWGRGYRNAEGSVH